MDFEANQELLQIYFEEAEEHLEGLVQCILEMESNGPDSRILDETYRRAHSLKGSSSIVGFDEITRIAHLVEDVFDALRSHKTEFNEKLVDLFLHSTDTIKSCLVYRKEENGQCPDTEPLCTQLQEALRQIQPMVKIENDEPLQNISPELLSVMTEHDTMRLEMALEQNENIYEILLSLNNETFIEDIRIVNSVLESIGQILVKNRPASSPKDDSNIPLKVQFLCTYDSDYISRCLNGIEHTIEKVDLKSKAIELDNQPEKTDDNHLSEQVLDSEQETKAKKFESLRNQYILDSIEKLVKSVDLILGLEKDPMDEKTLEEIFRIFHTFKGSGTGYDFPKVSEIAHEMESILEQVRNSQLVVDASVIDKLLSGVDRLNVIFHKTEHHSKIQETDSKTDFQPGTPDIDSDSSVNEKAINETEQKKERSIPPEKTSAKVDSRASTYTAEETLRVNMKKIDELVNISSEILVSRDSEQQVLQELKYTTQLSRQLLRSFNTTKDEMKLTPQLREFIDNGPMAKIFSDAGQKLIDLNNRLGHLLNTVTTGATKTDTLATELQKKVMNVRMMPISTIFQKFQRLVRDLSHDQGKNINLVIKGETNELDKKVLEEIGDPLVHLIRNSIDHGIETTEERVKKQKTETGTIRLEALQIGNHMIIEVEDDGRGIDPEKIRQTAIRKGIITQESVKSLSEQELLDLLFTPAFSTSEKITQISGRGVGLDVVKTNIEKLHGTIEVDSEIDRGTKFSLRIPITLAIVRVLIINVQGLFFAIPAGVIEHILKIHKSEYIPIDGQQVILNRGEPLSAIALSDLLGLQSNGNDNELYTGLICSSVGRRVCLLVDRVERVQDVVLKSLGSFLQNVPHISGGCIQRDGDIVIILDILSLARQVLSPTPRTMDLKHVNLSKPKDQKTVMVVEDSLITRDMLSSILLASGYKVIEAADGVEALSKLRRQKCDLVVTDIVMPNMSGFELTQAIRTHDSLSNIPIVIVTNKEKEEDRLRGMQVRADAYIVKSRFDQKNLLTTIEDLLSTS